MTLEAVMPYVSVGCAIGAAAAAMAGPSPGLQRALKALALLALAVFAFLRGSAPAALAMALTLGGLAQAAATRERDGRTRLSDVLFVLAWLVLAWLFLREGRGLPILAEPARLGAALLVLAATAGLVVWSRRAAGPGPVSAAASVVLGLLILAALTLRAAQWPAMAGAAVLFVAHAVHLAFEVRPQRAMRRIGAILAWALAYAAQATMAYVFLR